MSVRLIRPVLTTGLTALVTTAALAQTAELPAPSPKAVMGCMAGSEGSIRAKSRMSKVQPASPVTASASAREAKMVESKRLLVANGILASAASLC